MNLIFGIIFCVCCVFCLIVNPDGFLSAVTQGGENAIALSVKLFAIYLFWLGIMEVADGVGITRGLARLLKPISRGLFGVFDEKTQALISTNLSANLLGIGNIGTLSGIEAVRRMEDDGNDKGAIAFFVVNASSIQLIPTTVLSLRQAHGSSNPYDILLPAIIISLTTTVVGYLTVKAVIK